MHGACVPETRQRFVAAWRQRDLYMRSRRFSRLRRYRRHRRQFTRSNFHVKHVFRNALPYRFNVCAVVPYVANRIALVVAFRRSGYPRHAHSTRQKSRRDTRYLRGFAISRFGAFGEPRTLLSPNTKRHSPDIAPIRPGYASKVARLIWSYWIPIFMERMRMYLTYDLYQCPRARQSMGDSFCEFFTIEFSQLISRLLVVSGVYVIAGIRRIFRPKQFHSCLVIPNVRVLT